jgi:tetratricopeptide (TPR) repeat protein
MLQWNSFGARRPGLRLVLALLIVFPFLPSCSALGPAARLDEARGLLQAGKAAEAAAILHELRDDMPGDYAIEYELARAEQAAGNPEAAIIAVASAVQADPASLDARLLRGMILGDLGRDQEALAELRQVIAGAPARPGVHRTMGLIHARAGRQQRASNQFDKELEINPADAIALTESGILHLSRGELAQAADRLEQAVKVAPDSARAHRYLAEVLFRQARYEPGLELQRRAFRLHPRNLDLLLDHAKALHNYGHPDEARQLLDEALAAPTPDLRLYLEAARQAREQLDNRRAIAALREAILLNPTLPDGWLDLGKLYRLEGEQAEALLHLQEAERLAPMNPFVCFHLGTSLEDAGRDEEAMEMYRRALQLDPNNPMAHYALARLLQRAGRRAEAEREFALHAEIMKRKGKDHERTGVASMD